MKKLLSVFFVLSFFSFLFSGQYLLTKKTFLETAPKSPNIVNYFQELNIPGTRSLFDLHFLVGSGFKIESEQGDIPGELLSGKLMCMFPLFEKLLGTTDIPLRSKMFIGVDIIALSEEDNFKLTSGENVKPLLIATGENILGMEVTIKEKVAIQLSYIGNVLPNLANDGAPFPSNYDSGGVTPIPGVVGEGHSGEVRTWWAGRYKDYRSDFLMEKFPFGAFDFLNIGRAEIQNVFEGKKNTDLPFVLDSYLLFYGKGANTFDAGKGSLSHSIYFKEIARFFGSFLEYSIVPFHLNELRLEANIALDLMNKGENRVSGKTINYNSPVIYGDKNFSPTLGGSVRFSYFRGIGQSHLVGFYLGAFVNLTAVFSDSLGFISDIFLAYDFMFNYSEAARTLIGLPTRPASRIRIMYRTLLPQ